MSENGDGVSRCVIEYDPASGSTRHRFEGAPFPTAPLVSHLNSLMVQQAMVHLAPVLPQMMAQAQQRQARRVVLPDGTRLQP